MPPQECHVIFFGAPRVAEGNGIIIEEGQIMDSTILATKMTNHTKGGTFVSDGAKALGGVAWNWDPLEEPIWGRAKDIEVTPRTTSFTLELGVLGVLNVQSDCEDGSKRVINIYWDNETQEIVTITEEEENG